MSAPRTKAYSPQFKVGYSFADNDCPVAAISCQDNSPNNLINIIHLENSIYENTKDFYKVIQLSGSSGLFPISYYTYSSGCLAKYLISDINSSNGSPLFYQYELMFDCYGDSLDPNLVVLYKNNELVVDSSEYNIQFSYNLLGTSTRYDNSSWSQQGDVEQSRHRIRVLFPIDFYGGQNYYFIKYKKIVNNLISDQEELLDIVPLYSDSNYEFTSSGIVINSGVNEQGTINIIKDPSDRIDALYISSSGTLDGYNSWRLNIKTGIVAQNSGSYTGLTPNVYCLKNYYTSGYLSYSGIQPTFVGDNVIKIDQYPLFISGCTYPDYRINDISFYVDNLIRSDLNVLSVDKNHGFIHINSDVSDIDNLTITCKVQSSGFIRINNLELNPNVSGSLYNISGFSNGFGISLAPYDDSYESTLLYIYDASKPISERICYGIPSTGTLPDPINWTDSAFFSLCEIAYNRLSSDAISIDDARRIGGGYNSIDDLNSTIQTQYPNYKYETNWYVGNGYYGGSPLAYNGLIIINIPEDKLIQSRQKWIDEFKKYSGTDESAIKEFNYYMDSVIRRYVSAGTDYIIVPVTSSGTFGDILDLRN